MYIKHNWKVYKEVNLKECNVYELEDIILDLIKDNKTSFVSWSIQNQNRNRDGSVVLTAN